MVNVLLNPTFLIDINGDGIPDDWNLEIWIEEGQTPPDVGVSIDAEGAVITYNNVPVEIPAAPLVALTQYLEALTLVPGEPITISIDCKHTLPGGWISFFMHIFDENWNVLKTLDVYFNEGDGQWHSGYVTDTIPENAAFLAIYCKTLCTTAAAPTSIHFRNAVVEIGVVPPPPCDSYLTQAECEAAGCFWYDGICHSTAPPDKGYLDIHTYLNGEEIVVPYEVVEAVVTGNTPALVEVDPGTYTVTATYNGEVKTETVTVLEGQTKRVDFQFGVPPPTPPIDLPTIGGIALAIADAVLIGYYIYTKVVGKVTREGAK